MDVFQSCKSNSSVEITDVVLSEGGNRRTLINATYRVQRDINPNSEVVNKICPGILVKEVKFVIDIYPSYSLQK